jgi:hypothetical protein
MNSNPSVNASLERLLAVNVYLPTCLPRDGGEDGSRDSLVLENRGINATPSPHQGEEGRLRESRVQVKLPRPNKEEGLPQRVVVPSGLLPSSVSLFAPHAPVATLVTHQSHWTHGIDGRWCEWARELILSARRAESWWW